MAGRKVRGPRWATVAMTGALVCHAHAQGRPDVTWMAGGHGDWVTDVAYSQDGRLLITCGSEAKLWRVSDGTLLRTLPRSSQIAAFSPDGECVVTMAAGGRDLQLWRVADGRLLWKRDTAYFNDFCFAPDGQTLFVAQDDGRLTLWKMPAGELIETRTAHQDGISSVAISPDGELLATGSRDLTLKLWRSLDGELIRTFDDDDEVLGVEFSPDQRTLASAGKEFGARLKLWRIADGQLLRTFDEQLEFASDITFSPDARTLAACGSSGVVRLWHVDDGGFLGTLTGHRGTVRAIAFSPDGRLLASGGNDHMLRLWRVARLRQVGTLTQHTEAVHGFAFSPDGQWVATGSHDGTVRLIQALDGAPVRTLAQGKGEVWRLAFSPDSRILAVGSESGALELYELPNGELVRSFAFGGVRSLDFSSDGTLLGAGSIGGQGQVWRVSDGSIVHTISDGAVGVSFGPDGKTLASCGGTGRDRMQVWSIPGGELIQSIVANIYFRSIAYSPDGRTIAAGGIWGRITLWRISDGAMLWEQWTPGHAAAVDAISFSPDGRTVISSAEAFSSVCIWRVADGALLDGFNEETRTAYSAQYSADGRAVGWGRSDASAVVAGSPYQGEVDCGGGTRLVVRCPRSGAKVVARVKAATPGMEVTFTLDSQMSRTIETDDRGTARVRYSANEQGDHTVRACGLKTACAGP